MAPKNYYRPLKRIFKRVVILMVFIVVISWMIGFNKIWIKWNFFWRGSGSTEKVEQFYKTAAQQDSIAFLNLFSHQILQTEGKENILSALRFSYLYSEFNLDFKTKITDKRMKGDTAIIEMIVQKYSGEPIAVTFLLLKEKGDWKITFAE